MLTESSARGDNGVDKIELQAAIESCREEMISLSDKYGLSALVVIQTSKHLDHLLNRLEDAERIG